jgi:4-aminobutyrate aminotransferase-like enzyme
MFKSQKLSLSDILGKEYMQSVAESLDALNIMKKEKAMRIAVKRVDLYPQSKQKADDALLSLVGKSVAPAFKNEMSGAPTNAFAKASHLAAAPLTGTGCYRVGEDGKLYLIGKSEHYHASLGHNFNGYKLIDHARELGILNPTHNNTRGYITRLLEYRIIQAVNGIPPEDRERTEKIFKSTAPKVLNRVINLETGSVAVEAGIKMMLARFYRLDPSFREPKYSGKTPVFFVMADNNGESGANYHGTSVIAQTFRGMWPDCYRKMDGNGAYKVVPVRINDIRDFRAKIKKYNTGGCKVAGFLHEIIMMNFGAVRLTPGFLRAAYEACREADIPTLVDEIQSCMWYKGMFLHRLYGLEPDFVVIGKGFSGGEYPASKIITTAEMDTLNQFGALVTNGQEELASLSYLVTMAFSEANGAKIDALGKFFQRSLREVAGRHPDKIDKIEGQGHLIGIHFKNLEEAADAAKAISAECVDTSAQLYKANCPPVILFKPPLTASKAVLSYIADTVDRNV